MNRWSWALLGAVVLALAVYAFRPAPADPTAKPFLTVQAGTAYTLEARGLTQVVAGDRVTVAGLERVVDTDRTGPLWGAVVNLRVAPERLIPGVRLADLPTYGLAAAARLEGSTPAGPIHLRWGRSGDQAYVWDGISQRLGAVDPAVVASLDQAAGRLDRRALLTIPDDLRRIAVDGTVLVRGDSGWTYELNPARPPASARVEALVRLLAQVELTDLQATPVPLAPVVGRIEFGLGPAATTIVVHQVGDALRLTVDRLPPQVIADPAPWRPALAAVQTDVLAEVSRTIGDPSTIEAVRLTRGGAPIVALERGENLAKSQEFRWEVAWPGGREAADPGALRRLMTLLDDLRIEQPQAQATDPSTSTGLVITVQAERSRVVLALDDDGTVRSATHAGRLLQPERLRAGMAADALLDPRLATRSPRRIAKIQRRVPADSRAEVLTRADGGTWSRTWPAPASPVDGAAVDRLVRLVASAQAQAIRLADTPDEQARARAILAQPEAEIALRYAPAEVGQAANDETDLDETASQDWGLALVRTGPAWEATDAEGGVLLTLDAETVEGLLAPVEGGRCFPLVPAAVTALEATTAAGTWRITRQGDGWTSTTVPRVDALAVRRLLRLLGTLPGTPDARLAEPTAPIARLTAEVPALGGGTERLRLLIAPDGTAWVGSDQVGSAFPRGGGLAVPADLIPSATALTVAP